MEFKESFKRLSIIIFVMVVVFFYVGVCSPVKVRSISYREGIDQETATAKLYRDRLARLKKERYNIIPDANENPNLKNQAFRQNSRVLSKEEPMKEVKSVMPGEKTMKQHNDDDEDYDDGGEYEGLNQDFIQEQGNQFGKKKEKEQSCNSQDSVPMMIIREVDMVAMKIPVQDPNGPKSSKYFNDVKGFKDVKDANNKADLKKQKEWSEWSPCSKPCGKGVQSRWRLTSGLQEKEQQLRPCNLGECSSSRDFQLHHSFP